MIKNIDKKVNQLASYDPQMQRYCIETLYPALSFIQTERAKLFCAKRVENHKEIYANLDLVRPTYYSIIINGRIIYIGSAYRPFSRAACHITSIMNEPRKWGLTFKDINKKSFKIKVVLGSQIIYNNLNLRREEYKQILKETPCLQFADGSDRLIPMKARREAMRKAGVC